MLNPYKTYHAIRKKLAKTPLEKVKRPNSHKRKKLP